MVRDSFAPNTKERLAARVNSVCSNPNCCKQTRGPTFAPDGFINIGVAAHITAASPGGPRFDPGLPTQARRSAENGIWVCQDCAKLVDSDEDRFTVIVLRAWKLEAEAEAEQRLGVQASQLSSEAILASVHGRLERTRNSRFGFSFVHPAMWDRDDPANGDGNTFRHPTDPRIEVRAWGGFAVVSSDLAAWVAWTLEDNRKKPSFTLLTKGAAGGKLVDWNFRNQDGPTKVIEQVEGYRISYSTEEKNLSLTAMQTFLQYGDTQVGCLCKAPTALYKKYLNPFLVISKGIYILGPSAAPYARIGQV